jgi:hypothetical protein
MTTTAYEDEVLGDAANEVREIIVSALAEFSRRHGTDDPDLYPVIATGFVIAILEDMQPACPHFATGIRSALERRGF